ncbi:MAG TPA: alginate export family protein [Flavobacteriaceae bacterium]|nr:alginate export family protein [Flavobacteriaceae bacterium]
MGFKKAVMLIALQLTIINSFAQFEASGELRPRTEYRHGFGSLIQEDAEPGYGISTRARINFGYKTESFDFYMSFQDVFVWGENRQLKPEDSNNSFAVFQAWADIKLSERSSTKIGRQMLIYDDQRILGGVDWAQQARNHDAIVFKYKKKKFQFDLGLAFNQDYDNPSGFISSGNVYNTMGYFSYKTMQYAYLKKSWASFSGSLLILNNGFQDFESDNTTPDGISSLQTIGAHLGYKKGNFSAAANLFLQTGKRQGDIDVNGAHLAGLELSYKASDKLAFGVGTEIISGNDGDAGETGAFFPLYGTNHKFNGFMDYFYVGNHANSVGLFDIHASANFTFKNNSSLLIKVLNFSGEQELPSGEKSLGTEVDLVYTKKFKGYTLKAGYSQMFVSDGMYELKGVLEDDAASIQNWAWVMIVFKPKFL